MKTIIQRELLEHIHSLQFVILLLVSIVLFSVSGYVSTNTYKENIEKYNQNILTVSKAPSTRFTMIYRKPNPLSFIADGGLQVEPDRVSLQPKGSIGPSVSNQGNFKMPDIPYLDWTFIIKIIFSLYVILISFQSISGEKENGTLQLILSNSIGRNSLLISKYISIIGAIAVPLILGGLVSLLISSFTIPDILSLKTIGRVIIMFILAMLYLSVFAFMGLFISSLVKKSSLVLLVLLAVWTSFVFVIPNLAGVLANRLSGLPSEQEMAKKMGLLIQNEIWEKIGKITARIDKNEFDTKEAVLAATDKVFEDGQIKVKGYFTDFRNMMNQRALLSRNISRISPAALFQFTAEGVGNSGYYRQKQFMDDISIYSGLFDDYIKRKLGKVVATSMWAFSTSADFHGEHLYISSPSAKEYNGDKSDFPRFQEQNQNIKNFTRHCFIDFAGLLIWNLILCLLAFIVFSRSDVR